MRKGLQNADLALCVSIDSRAYVVPEPGDPNASVYKTFIGTERAFHPFASKSGNAYLASSMDR